MSEKVTAAHRPRTRLHSHSRESVEEHENGLLSRF